MKVLSNRTVTSKMLPYFADRLDRSLEGIQERRDDVLVTPLVKEEPWQSAVDNLIYAFAGMIHMGDLPEWLRTVEVDRMGKISPMSIRPSWIERRPKILADFFEPRPKVELRPDAARYAFQQLVALVPSKLHAASLETSFRTRTRGRNKGLPYFTTEGEWDGQMFQLAMRIMKEGYPRNDWPAFPWVRIQAIDKARLVWGYPGQVVLLERRLLGPVVEYLRENSYTFCAWVGPEEVDLRVTRLFDMARGRKIHSIDFSGFDASVSFELIDVVYDALSQWFSRDTIDLIDYCREAFKTVGLITPDGVWVERSGGVPSGSGLTNLVDSFVQYFAMHYVAFELGTHVESILVQGDDGVVLFQDNVDPELLEEKLHELGLKMSATKGIHSAVEIQYLQNVHHRDYFLHGRNRGVRPLMRVLNGMLWYEYKVPHWSGADDTLRWWQQLNNAQWHPSFVEACRFIYDRDYYSRDYSLRTIIEMAGGLDEVEKLFREDRVIPGKTSVRHLIGSNVQDVMNAFRVQDLRENHPKRVS